MPPSYKGEETMDAGWSSSGDGCRGLTDRRAGDLIGLEGFREGDVMGEEEK